MLARTVRRVTIADLIVLTRGFPALCASVRACPVRRLFLLSSDLTPAEVVVCPWVSFAIALSTCEPLLVVVEAQDVE